MASNHIRLGFKYKLRLTGKQEREFIRYFGHARYTYNSFIDNMQEDYQEYLEDVESRLIFGEANSLKVLLLFKSGINLLTRFGKTNPINFDKNLNSISGSLSNKKAA